MNTDCSSEGLLSSSLTTRATTVSVSVGPVTTSVLVRSSDEAFTFTVRRAPSCGCCAPPRPMSPPPSPPPPNGPPPPPNGPPPPPKGFPPPGPPPPRRNGLLPPAPPRPWVC